MSNDEWIQILNLCWIQMFDMTNFFLLTHSKSLGNVDMQIDVAIDQLKVFFFFENYRENGFIPAMISAKEIANEIEIEPKFHD